MLKFSDRSIAAKIWLGSATIVTLLAVTSTLAKIGFDSAEAHFASFRSLAQQTNQMHRLQQDVLRSHLYVMRYVDGSHTAKPDAEHELDRLAEQIAAGPTDPARTALRQEVTDYRRAFGEIVTATERLEAIRRDELAELRPKLGLDASDLLAILAAAADVRVVLQAADLGLIMVALGADTEAFLHQGDDAAHDAVTAG